MTTTAQEIGNSSLRLQFDQDRGVISGVRGRFRESDEFGQNLLSPEGLGWHALLGSRLERLGTGDHSLRVLGSDRTATRLHCELGLFAEGESEPVLVIEWLVAIVDDHARVSMSLLAQRDLPMTALAVKASCPQRMLVGLFERGVVQQVSDGAAVFASGDPLSAFYTIDAAAGSFALVPRSASGQSVLFTDQEAGEVGILLVQAGRLPREDEWAAEDWTDAGRAELRAGDSLSVEFELYANDLPFPTHAIGAASFDDARDAQTHFTALYGSQVGCLGSYAVPGSAYPTLAMPHREYGPLHTFFDPDAWSLTNALSFSGDPYLQRQSRLVLERSLSGITEEGLLPHHFDGEEPCYVAISGTAQPGPNLFWCMAALDYVNATGDVGWLERVWTPGLVAATDWVLDRYEPSRKLLCVDGPLWVDVFRREGYTFDTNAMAVHVLERMAQASSFLEEPDYARALRATASQLRVGLDSLWAGEDHYLTARDADWNLTFDRVDSENYLAVAFGISDESRSRAIIRRLDAGAHTHPGGKGTWVSERRYEEADCYGGNTGDSSTAMARLWWADLAARCAQGDRRTFAALYEPVRQDLLDLTWMNERYDEHGRMVRAEGYHEYPGVLDMMLREGYHGITLDLETVTIRPMLSHDFAVSLGQLLVEHSPENVRLRVPGRGERAFRVHGLRPGGGYRMDGGERIEADDDGVVRFGSSAGDIHTLTLLDAGDEGGLAEGAVVHGDIERSPGGGVEEPVQAERRHCGGAPLDAPDRGPWRRGYLDNRSETG
jgi:hypothetical protein